MADHKGCKGTGEYEEDRLVRSEVVTVGDYSIELPVDKDYAVLAVYFDGPDTFFVLDADDICAREVIYRNRDCWEVDDGEIDIRLPAVNAQAPKS